MEKIGFVGTGAMGSALLSRLKLANVQATAFDIAPAAMEAARKEGAQTATSAKAVAQASTIVDVVVRTDQEVLDCTMGKDGILEGAAPGTLVLLHSTIRPTTTKKNCRSRRRNKGLRDRRLHDGSSQRRTTRRTNFPRRRAKGTFRSCQTTPAEHGQGRGSYGPARLRQRHQAI